MSNELNEAIEIAGYLVEVEDDDQGLIKKLLGKLKHIQAQGEPASESNDKAGPMGEPCKSDPILEDMMNTGLLPPECRRAVIDLKMGELAQVYYECYGDKSIVDLLPKHLSSRMKISQSDEVT